MASAAAPEVPRWEPCVVGAPVRRLGKRECGLRGPGPGPGRVRVESPRGALPVTSTLGPWARGSEGPGLHEAAAHSRRQGTSDPGTPHAPPPPHPQPPTPPQPAPRARPPRHRGHGPAAGSVPGVANPRAAAPALGSSSPRGARLAPGPAVSPVSAPRRTGPAAPVPLGSRVRLTHYAIAAPVRPPAPRHPPLPAAAADLLCHFEFPFVWLLGRVGDARRSRRWFRSDTSV